MATVVDVGGQRLAVGAALGGESGAHLLTQRLDARLTQAVGHRQVASIGLRVEGDDRRAGCAQQLHRDAHGDIHQLMHVRGVGYTLSDFMDRLQLAVGELELSIGVAEVNLRLFLPRGRFQQQAQTKPDYNNPGQAVQSQLHEVLLLGREEMQQTKQHRLVHCGHADDDKHNRPAQLGDASGH